MAKSSSTNRLFDGKSPADAFWQGYASVFMPPNMQSRTRNLEKLLTPKKRLSDAEAIASYWQATGDYMRSAMGQMDVELASKGKK